MASRDDDCGFVTLSRLFNSFYSSITHLGKIQQFNPTLWEENQIALTHFNQILKERQESLEHPLSWPSHSVCPQSSVLSNTCPRGANVTEQNSVCVTQAELGRQQFAAPPLPLTLLELYSSSHWDFLKAFTLQDIKSLISSIAQLSSRQQSEWPDFPHSSFENLVLTGHADQAKIGALMTGSGAIRKASSSMASAQ